jgi:SAM-dependent methyltransferase
MDLRPYQPRPELIDELKRHCHYQPFILSDDIQSGAADYWVNGGSIWVMHRHQASEQDWRRFTEVNGRMRRMYDSWIESVAELVGGVGDADVVDVGCNAGYFLYRFLQLGARSCTGYDRAPEMARPNAILGEITGLRADFVAQPYDMWTHRVDGARAGDVVISSALMCHLSDPLYHLAFLGSITRRALLLFSAITDEPGFRITHEGAKVAFPNDPFPVCFDLMTRVSRPLVDFGLAELGFRRVVELRHRSDWLPLTWYRGFQALVALR